MYLDRNLNLIADRWPELAKLLRLAPDLEEAVLVTDAPETTLMVNGIHLSSRYDRRREASIQAELIPAESSRAHVYGLALGDLPRVLLTREELKELTLVILNPQLARVSLTFFDHSDWLADPRVHLVSAVAESNVRLPFACSPASLHLADDRSARLRDLVQLELATPFIQRIHKIREPGYLKRIDENEPFLANDQSVAQLFGSCPGGDIVIAAAGPTLADHYLWLRKKRSEYLLIAVDVTVRSLLAENLIPDLVVAIDSNPCLFDNAFSGLAVEPLAQTALVYFPLVEQKLLAFWPGRRFVTYSHENIYQQTAERFPGGRLFSAGSVIHPAVDLAAKLGAARVVLLGADFSFPGQKSHVEGAGVSANTVNTGAWVHNGEGQRVSTLPNYRGYLRDLETYIMLHPEINFMNGSKKGAFIEGTRYLEGNC